MTENSNTTGVILLSLEKTNALKGLFTVTVLFHHLQQNTNFISDEVLCTLFHSLGYLSVSMFFFLSGYGITFSYLKKGSAYISGFLKNKVLALYSNNLIIIGIYLIFWKIIGVTVSKKRIILSFFFGNTVIKYGWFIQALLLMYLIFYAAHKIRSKIARVIIFLISYFLYYRLCVFSDCWEMWYISVPAFGMGVLTAYCKKISHINFVIFGIFFLTTYILGNFFILNSEFSIKMKICSAVIFPLFIIKIIGFQIGKSKFFQAIGKYSFEIYVSQGIFISLFHSDTLYIKNDLFYILCIIFSTVLFAFLLKNFFTFKKTVLKI